MKVLITGSHFTPAQATIGELKKLPGMEIVYLGRKTTREGDNTPSVESQVLPKLGVKFIPIQGGRLQRNLSLFSVLSLFKVPIGLCQAFYYLLKEKPDVVLSFGGYLAVPVVFSAWLLSIPVIIHEQTLVQGIANKVTSLFANKVAVSFDQTKKYYGKKAIFTGNPIRKELLEEELTTLDSEIKKAVEEKNKKHLSLIVVTGGNQGAHIINENIGNLLEDLTRRAIVIHQTGDSKYQDFENLTAKKELLEHKERYIIKKWIDASELGFILKNSDLVISRAGVNTLLELAFFGVPNLVIPLPYVQKDEQVINAKYFSSLGLSQVLIQKELNPENLLNEISQMLKNKDYLKKTAQSAKVAVIESAASNLSLETIILASKK